MRRYRPTIMDGIVVTYALNFIPSDGAFGTHFKAIGPFEISVRRNAVIVHRAEMCQEETLSLVKAVLDEAFKVYAHLRRYDEVPDDIRAETKAAEEEFKKLKATAAAEAIR